MLMWGSVDLHFTTAAVTVVSNHRQHCEVIAICLSMLLMDTVCYMVGGLLMSEFTDWQHLTCADFEDVVLDLFGNNSA